MGLWNDVFYNKEDDHDVCWIPSCSLFVKRDIFESVHGFDERLLTSEDVDLSVTASQYGRIVYSMKLDVIHLGEPNSLFDFFKKELWRGRSVPKLFIKHRGKVGLKPILLGVYSIFYLLSVLIVLFVDWKWGLDWLLVGFLPYLLAGMRDGQLGMLDKIRLSWLYLVYGIARGIAIILPKS